MICPPNSDVVKWPDYILISSYTWNKYFATLPDIFTKSSQGHPLTNYAKYEFSAPSQEFLGMIVGDTIMRPSLSKLDAIADMPAPSNVKKVRYLPSFFPRGIKVAALLTNLLRSKAFVSKRASNIPTGWGYAKYIASHSLRNTQSNSTVRVFPSL